MRQIFRDVDFVSIRNRINRHETLSIYPESFMTAAVTVFS